MVKKIIFILTCLFLFKEMEAQLSLKETVDLAITQSSGFKLAQTQKEISYYQYLAFKSNFKPQISLYGNAPVYNNEYYGVRQPDGSILYASINQNLANVGFALTQTIPWTGGEISLNTAITRFDDFEAKTHQYNGLPVFLQLKQSLFTVNNLKWQQKLQPLLYEESKKSFAFEMEHISEQTVDFYFAVLSARSDINSAKINLENTTSNYEIEKKRVLLGSTTEDRLLQLELQMLRSSQSIEKAKYDYQIAQLNLKTFAGIKVDSEVEVILPDNIKSFEVEVNTALKFAKIYRPEYIAFERRKLEAEFDVAKAKSSKNQVNLFASFGLNSIGSSLGNIYQNVTGQQQINVGFNIPIIDWGRSKASVNTALAVEKLITFNNELDETNLEQQIITLIKTFELLKQNIIISEKTNSVALRRYEIANELYQQGKMSVSDLNLAQSEKDLSTKNYLQALWNYWSNYYEIRKLTLYDFENNKSLFSMD